MTVNIRPSLERLETREVPALFGTPWANNTVTVSFVPDGTAIVDQMSDLESRGPSLADDWQRETLLALHEWSRHANVHIATVEDDGQMIGALGRPQDDPRFGDIRIAGVALNGDVLAVTSPSDPTLTNTRAGDIIINTAPMRNGSPYHFSTMMLHEVGHALGVDHSNDPHSPMYPTLQREITTLTANDIQAIQRLYGTRRADPHEGAQGNGSTATAAPLERVDDELTPLLAYGDLSTRRDVDVYSFTTPPIEGDEDQNQNITIRLQSSGLSLLVAQVRVYFLDEDGKEVEVANSTANPDSLSGSTLYLTFDGNDEDGPRQYFVEVQQAKDTAFDTGLYALAVTFDDDESDDSNDDLDEVVRYAGSSLTNRQLAQLLDNKNADIDITATGATPGTASALSAAAGTREARFEVVSTLRSSGDVDVFAITAPSDGSLSTLSVQSWYLSDGQSPPMLRVLDATGTVLPSEIVVNDQGLLSLQLPEVAAGSRVFIEASARPGQLAGNYYLFAEFRSQQTRIDQLMNTTLTSDQPMRSMTLLIGETQLFHLHLSVNSTSAQPGDTAMVRLRDEFGQVLFERSARIGETISGATMWLRPGNYRIEVLSTTPLLANTGLQVMLNGIRITDPIGPLLRSTTLSATPRDPAPPPPTNPTPPPTSPSEPTSNPPPSTPPSSPPTTTTLTNPFYWFWMW